MKHRDTVVISQELQEAIKEEAEFAAARSENEQNRRRTAKRVSALRQELNDSYAEKMAELSASQNSAELSASQNSAGLPRVAPPAPKKAG